MVTECAAICAYLADVFPDAGLGPCADEKADYYRWLFYAAGPLEAAVSNQAMGWQVPTERERMFGYGNFDKAIAAVDELFSLREYVCGDRFTAADVYVGSHIGFGMQFGTIDKRPAFGRYWQRLSARPAALRAKEIDDPLTPHQQVQPAR